jgi:CheY-like chemotaxis protein
MNDTRALKILVADDTDSDRFILETIVRKEGHQVFVAKNGLEAVAIFEKERPDIVLLDALMPELDGFGAARQIKALAGDELVPIIFLTCKIQSRLLAVLMLAEMTFYRSPITGLFSKQKLDPLIACVVCIPLCSRSEIYYHNITNVYCKSKQLQNKCLTMSRTAAV